jgi:hypothetical protein
LQNKFLNVQNLLVLAHAVCYRYKKVDLSNIYTYGQYNVSNKL